MIRPSIRTRKWRPLNICVPGAPLPQRAAATPAPPAPCRGAARCRRKKILHAPEQDQPLVRSIFSIESRQLLTRILPQPSTHLVVGTEQAVHFIDAMRALYDQQSAHRSHFNTPISETRCDLWDCQSCGCVDGPSKVERAQTLLLITGQIQQQLSMQLFVYAVIPVIICNCMHGGLIYS